MKKALVLKTLLIAVTGTLLFSVSAQAQTFEVLFSDNQGRYPRASLIQGTDGDFYGTTEQGGTSGNGTVFKITASGTHTLLHSFNSTDGISPRAGLVQGSDGSFYGTTVNGGASDYGTVFKITASGTHTVLHSFNNTNGRNPYAGLVQGSDGSFYGTTYQGGASGVGTVFKITASGTHTVLHSFNNTNGSQPYAGLVQGGDGSFYGTTYSGGASNNGTVFKITSSGTHTVLHSFNNTNGRNPYAGLVLGSDGSFYGTTVSGGASNYGTVFKITASGTHTVLHSFNNTNGSIPRSLLVQGSDGSFYGTTYSGGASDYGTVFKITASGTHTLLHSFNDTNGRNPLAGLVQGSDGSFYGTTYQGGASDNGTVFKITASGTHTLLHSFNGTNGRNPYAGLVQGSDGSFYGTAQQGGASNNGTVFKITASGTHTVLHSFNSTNGSSPYARLVQGSDGSFYGTAYGGGASGFGTVFKITASGTHTLLHTFNSTNGSQPYAGLVQGSDGSFYGTTINGGASSYGTVFKITASGTQTLLYSFDGSIAAYPRGTPTFGSDGNLYGTANQMVIWRMTFGTAPVATTLAASSTGGTGTTLNGTVNPGGLTTTAQFEYGTTDSYGSTASVTLSPDNGTSNQNVSATLSSLTPGTTYHYRLSANNSQGTSNGDDMTFTTLDDDADLSDLTLSAGTLTPSFASNVLSYTASVPSNVSSLTLTPTLADTNASFTVNGAANAPLALNHGSNVITVLVTAEDGTTAQAYVLTVTRSSDPTFTTLHSKGGAVPNAGVVGSGIPAGAIWSKLGIPAINDAGQIAVYGEWVAGKLKGAGIFIDGALVVAKGAAAPGLTNTIIGTLKDPILGPDGSVAVVAGLANALSTTGAVTTATNSALLFDADGSGAGAAVVLARKGTAAPGVGAALWKSFDSVSLGGTAVAILGKLSGAGITTLNDQCLWMYDRATTTTTLVLREGNPLLGSTVKVISALVARAATGQGGGVLYDGLYDQIAVRVTLTNKLVAVGRLPNFVPSGGDYSVFFEHITGNAAPDYGVGATWKSFGIPGQSDGSGLLAFVGTVQGGSATTANNVAIFTGDYGSSLFAVKRLSKGTAAAGITSGVFGGFKDPVNGTGGAFAFVGSTALNSSAGIVSTNNDGVWHHDGSTLSLVAREGEQPAGVTAGAKWKAFTSVAMPHGRKPLFYATMTVGQGGITTASDTGIWATDSLGQVKKLIQEGGTFGSSTVKSFKALLPLTGSPAQTRSFNNNGEVVMQVTDAAGGTHLLHVAVP